MWHPGEAIFHGSLTVLGLTLVRVFLEVSADCRLTSGVSFCHMFLLYLPWIYCEDNFYFLIMFEFLIMKQVLQLEIHKLPD